MSTSVSDLAPFVAAVLRNKVTDDLREENESLSAEIQRLRADNQRLRTEGPSWTIAITGPGGAPVYATSTVLHRDMLRDGGMDDGSYAFENGATACRRDSLRGCRLVLTPEAGVGQERVYNFENELHDDLEMEDFYDNVIIYSLHLADLGCLILEVPLPNGHGLGKHSTLAEVEANTDPGTPICFSLCI